RREWLSKNGFRKFQPTAAIRKRRGWVAGEDGQEPARHLICEIEWIPPNAHVQIRGLLHVAHSVDVRIFRIHLFARGIDVVAQGFNKGATLGAEALLETPAAEC